MEIDWASFYEGGKLEQLLSQRRLEELADPYFKTTDFDDNPTCESPIEVLFAFAMMCHRHNTSGIDVYMPHVCPPDFSQCDAAFQNYANDTSCIYLFGPRDKVVLFPQTPIGRFRVDFLVMHQNWFGDSRYDGKRSAFVVECDGHEHHERTKRQAARDRQRDRQFAISGMTVLRFTGSELWQDAAKCADDAWALIGKRR